MAATLMLGIRVDSPAQAYRSLLDGFNTLQIDDAQGYPILGVARMVKADA